MRIVNLKTWKGPYVYAGRFMRFSPAGLLNASPLRNPFWIGKGATSAERKTALRLFREHLAGAIRSNDSKIVAALEQIQPDWALGCWCVDLEGEAIFTEPEVCHCQIIWKAWRWMRERAAQ